MSCTNLDEIEKAFSAAKKVNGAVELGRQLTLQRNVVNHFSTSILSANPRKSAAIKAKLLKLKKTSSGKSGKELCKIGSNLKAQGKHAEALLFLQLAADAFENERSWKGISKCFGEVNITAVNLIREQGETAVVKSQFLPVLHRIRTKFRVNRVDPRWVLSDVVCMSDIVDIHIAVKAYDGSEQLCKDGMQMLKSAFPADYMKYRVYARLLFNLSRIILHLASPTGDLKRLREVEDYGAQAIAAYKCAEDFGSLEEDEGIITEIERLLEWVRRDIRVTQGGRGALLQWLASLSK